ncbi:MAG TPA: ACT domain-containing protein [Acidimicrobiales bacterium]
MPHYAISAVGRDRPGIVAAFTEALAEAGCNLEDTSMTILRGHFAMMLIVATPDTTGDGIAAAVGEPAARHQLVTSVLPIDDDVPESLAGHEFVVSVYGADRPGIVAAITRLLADRGVNVVDLSTRVIGDPDRPVYAMVLEVTVPDRVDVDELATALGAEAHRLGIEASLHADDPDIL